MRLLHTTRLKVVNFTGDPPPYAILSHTWEDEEITLRDLEPGGNAESMKGYAKLEKSCALAVSQGYDYIWIDTCCIDKTSSAELSEAINSMFRWYREATVCYAFLADVSATGYITDTWPSVYDNSTTLQEVQSSRWLTRGWTLQELIAPKIVNFYNKHWDLLGTKEQAAKLIQAGTGIAPSVLLGADLAGFSVYSRMQWAAKRETTRPEDMAYCLLGIFDVNMPLLYGEGRKKAFQRLQEEIVKHSSDLSIFLWTVPRTSKAKAKTKAKGKEKAKDEPDLAFRGLFAEDITWFKDTSPNLEADPGITSLQDSGVAISSKGVGVTWSLSPITIDPAGTLFLAMLVKCGPATGGIIVQMMTLSTSQFCRVASDRVIWVRRREDGYETSDTGLLGGSQSLLSSPPGMPKEMFIKQGTYKSWGIVFDAGGICFRNQEYSSPRDGKWRVNLVEATSRFQLEAPDQEEPVWLAHGQQDIMDSGDKTKKVKRLAGVLKVQITKMQITCDTNVPALCITVGYHILPPTALGTKTTFAIPWLSWHKGYGSVQDVYKAALHRPRRSFTEVGYGGYWYTCELKRILRASGLWYDIVISRSEREGEVRSDAV